MVIAAHTPLASGLGRSRFHARERRRAAVDLDGFAADIASPFDLGTVGAGSPLPNPYVIPANSRLAISFSVGLTATELTLATEVGRTLGTPALATDEIHKLQHLERARTLVPDAAIAGTISLYVLDEWSRETLVATGIFT